MTETEPTNRTSPRRWWVVAGVLGLVTVAGVIEATQLMLPGGRMSHYEGASGFLKALYHTVPSWWLLALLIPAGWWLGTRYPLAPGRWKRRGLLHAAASLVFPVALFTLVAAFYGVTDGDMSLSTLRGRVRDFAQLYYVYYVFIYWLIVGAVHVLRYYRAVKNHEIGALRLRSDLSQARLSALRAQLDPHFLFNSLNTIVGLALEKGDEEVADAVTELSELLRESLRDDESHLVPLEKEMEFTRRYLRLQEHRFGDRLTFEMDAPEPTRSALVPAMLLQPLVENAIVHGVLPGSGPGTLAVRARREEDDLVLEVDDSGPGFSEEAARRDPETAAGDDVGIGLANTRARLQQLFGADARLTVGERPGGGGRVSIRLPFLAATPAEEPTGVPV